MNQPPYGQPAPFQGMGAPANIIPGAQQHTLYVGSLDRAVTENVLYEYFSKYGRISNFKVMREKVKGESRGFAFVDFQAPRDAEHARNHLNNAKIMNSYIRIMWKGEHKKVDQKANVFVKNIDPMKSQEEVHNYFQRFGGILSTHLSLNPKGESNGFAHIQFFQEEDARKCIEVRNHEIGNKVAIAEEFKTKTDREEQRNLAMRNLYIRDLPADITEDKIRALLGQKGTIASCLLRKSQQHNAFFALVAFEDHEKAREAFDAISSGELNFEGHGTKLYIAWNKTKAQLKEERDKSREQDRETILYLRNLKEDLTKETLDHALGEYGMVEWSNLKPFEATEGPNSAVSYKTQFALVKMRDREAAQNVLRNKHTELVRPLFIEKKPVFIDIAMPKGDRERMKAIQHRRFPYPFGFVGGPRGGAGGYPMPFSPFGPVQFGFPPQFQMPRMPNQMGGGGFVPRGRPQGGMRGGRGGHQGGGGRPYRGNGGGQHHQMGGHQMNPHQHVPQQQQQQQQQAPPQQLAASAQPKPAPAAQQKKKLDLDTVKKNWDNFKNLTPDQKRNVLGEFLYPKVEAKIGRELAPKITGMLVDFEVMTEEEIIQAIENDQVLGQRIKEAREALEEVD